jgi:hypothetical protein
MPQALPTSTPDPDSTPSSNEPLPTATGAVATATADVRTPEQIKKDERREFLENESVLAWTCGTRGYFEPSLWLVAIVSLFLTFWIGRLKESGGRTAALLMLVPLPLAMGVYGSIRAIRTTFEVIGRSGTEPDPSSLYVGYASALESTLYGMLLALPAFLLVLGFTIARCRQETSATN